MSGCCWEAIPVVREWSGDPTGCPGAPSGRSLVVGWPSRMSASCLETLLEAREWSGVLSECLGVFVRPYWMSGSGRQTLPYVREPLPDDR